MAQYTTIKGQYAHRVVMEEALGRKLRSDEVVHHKDGDTLNNKLENLEVIQGNGRHLWWHARERAEAECGHWSWIKCTICGIHADPLADEVWSNGTRLMHKECNRNAQRARRALRKAGA